MKRAFYLNFAPEIFTDHDIMDPLGGFSDRFEELIFCTPRTVTVSQVV